jgi:23S rRNA (cytosine1962-C5)-methyltransferase
MKPVHLRPGREQSLKARHPWIFSGAIREIPRDAVPGETVQVVTADGHAAAVGALSPASQIAVRVWSFDAGETIDAGFFRRRIEAALGRRATLPGCADTEALRLVNAESDGLPGLIVDRYGDFLVCQFLSAGAEFWRDTVAASLTELCAPRGIFERSDADVRQKEGLAPRTGVLAGEAPPARIEVRIGGLRFLADPAGGHKTGLYLDQRTSLARVEVLAAGRSVLNCFAYTGAFGLAALRGGACHVTNVDSSAPALDIAAAQLALNGFAPGQAENHCGDVFEVLRRFRDARRSFDLVVLDPPKFVANAGQLQRGSRAYKDINLLAVKLLNPGGLLVTFSCSGHVGPELFQKIVADAALDAGRELRFIEWLGAAPDHAVLSSFPQGRYLKGLVCAVD